MVPQVFAGPLQVEEHAIGSSDVHEVDLSGFALCGQQGAGGDHLDGVTEGGVDTDLGQKLKRLLGHLDVFLFAPGLDDLPNLFIGIVLGLNDEQSVQKIQRHAVRSI